MLTPFLLDHNTSVSLRDFLPGKNVKKSTDCGLSARADDMDVIDLALVRRLILVSSDVGLISKCKQFQRKNSCCLWGLLILPSGIEHQKRILSDLQKKKTLLRFREIESPLAWANIRDWNFLVKAELEGHPHVTELCDCGEWKKTAE